MYDYYFLIQCVLPEKPTTLKETKKKSLKTIMSFSYIAPDNIQCAFIETILSDFIFN